MKGLFRAIGAMLAISAASVAPTFAQITTGEPVARTITTGNRPTEGTYGVFIGASADVFITHEDLFDDNIISISPLPVFNFKYMFTDNFEVRCGLEWQRRTEKINGVGDNEEKTAYSIRTSEGTFTIRPGGALHFSSDNIFDVYSGAELIIGGSGAKRRIQDDNVIVSKSTFDIGAGVFIGFQAFIADLPLALGLEAELAFKYKAGLGQKAKVNGKESFNLNADNFPLIKDMYPGALSMTYSSLSASKGTIGSQFRLTFSYYFKR